MGLGFGTPRALGCGYIATVELVIEGSLFRFDLRHTCVAMWSRSLASPRAAAKWAGHSNPALILGVYGGVFDDESQSVMERLTTYATGARRRQS